MAPFFTVYVCVALCAIMARRGVCLTRVLEPPAEILANALAVAQSYEGENASVPVNESQVNQSGDINPIVYLHVPRTGSGFATVIAHHACGRDLPEDISVMEPSEFMDSWGQHCNRSKFGRFQSGHDPLPISARSAMEHVVVMMRDPSERVLSGYFHDLHDCLYLRQKYNCRAFGQNGQLMCDGDTETVDGLFVRDTTVISPLDYGRCVENCTANMLTGNQCGQSGPVDVVSAVRLIDDLGFVGLTDEWALSLCLWHKRFGGQLMPVEVNNMRVGVISAATGGFGHYDRHALLGHWRPKADGLVFEAAVRRFWSEIEKFGIKRESCEEEVMAITGEADQEPITSDSMHRASIDPIYYLQVPNSGSGFSTTIVHHVCGSDIPDDVWVQEPSEFFETWSPKCDRARFGRFETGHIPMSAVDTKESEHVVVLIRDPTQRVLSGYYDDLSDCGDLREKYNCQMSDQSGHYMCDGDIHFEDGSFVRNPEIVSPVEYGRCVENCTANMLTGRSCGEFGPPNIDRALDLVDKLGFVGLTDEWVMSVCLWHKRFGGRMLPAELIDFRPGVAPSFGTTTTYDAKRFLGGWQPTADTLVFAAAARRFWTEVEKFGVDRATCEREAATLVDRYARFK
eukprot:TRINITY_DN27_c0_g2_i2.p1 TRINITY_DN27_c0_g2~~TRINITY_DN27_c0_g2_i2.p1  ORF type:complete len:658 (+),score=63.26 TRINITY_DN27_c0_g2_i2:99-1976(+)